MGVPVIAFVGSSNSGKTTLLVRLIPELTKRGYKVATIKHAEEIDFEPGKDSSRHLQAGSALTVVITSEQIVLVKPAGHPVPIDEAVSLIGDGFDIILCEGYKHADVPKIEVHYDNKKPLLEGITGLVAVITDAPIDTNLRQFAFNDIEGIADFLEKNFIQTPANSLGVCANDTSLP